MMYIEFFWSDSFKILRADDNFKLGYFRIGQVIFRRIISNPLFIAYRERNEND